MGHLIRGLPIPQNFLIFMLRPCRPENPKLKILRALSGKMIFHVKNAVFNFREDICEDLEREIDCLWQILHIGCVIASMLS